MMRGAAGDRAVAAVIGMREALVGSLCETLAGVGPLDEWRLQLVRMLSAAGLRATVNQALQMLAAFGDAMGMGNERGQAAASLAENVGHEKRGLLLELLDEVLLPPEAAAVEAHLAHLDQLVADEEAMRLRRREATAVTKTATASRPTQPGPSAGRAAAPPRRLAAATTSPASAAPNDQKWHVPGKVEPRPAVGRLPPANSYRKGSGRNVPSASPTTVTKATPRTVGSTAGTPRKASNGSDSKPSPRRTGRSPTGGANAPVAASRPKSQKAKNSSTKDAASTRVKIFGGASTTGAEQSLDRPPSARYAVRDDADLNSTIGSELDTLRMVPLPPAVRDVDLPEATLSPWQSASEGELLQAARAMREIPMTMMTTPHLYHYSQAPGASADAAEAEALRQAVAGMMRNEA